MILWLEEVIPDNFQILTSTVYKMIQEGNTDSQKLLLNFFQIFF